jgi:diadenylate cyclase
MLPLVESLVRQITLTTVLDIAITAIFIYWLFSLIRGTRAVTLVIGVSVLLAVYALAQFLQLRLFTQILQAGAVVGLFALVVVFQPELRRALERIGRVGSMSWLLAPSEQRRIEHVAAEVAKACGILSSEGHGALIVIERETGLEEIAESGVMLHSDLSHELLTTIFAPRTELHDGAVIIRGGDVLAAAALLPLTEMTLSERFGTRHRAALGITEDTDAVAVVVSEENGQMSVVERARIVRVPTEAQLERALVALLEAPAAQAGLARGRRGTAARLRIARRRIRRTDSAATPPATSTPSPAGALAAGTSGASAPMAVPAARPTADPGTTADPRPTHARRRASSTAPGGAGSPSNGTAGSTALPPGAEGADAPDHDDDAVAHRVPEVPREDEGGTAAAAAANR